MISIGSVFHFIMRSTWGHYLMLGLALLAGVSAWGKVQKREGRRVEQSRRSVQTLKSIRKLQYVAAKIPTLISRAHATSEVL